MNDQQDSFLSTNVEVSDLITSEAISYTPVKTFHNPVYTPSWTGQCLGDSYSCESETYTDRKDPDNVFDISSVGMMIRKQLVNWLS